MDIVISGGGKVGETIARELTAEDNNVVMIEQKATRLENIINKIDITGIAGDGSDYENLVEAGVENCDIFIAVTAEDEINIISSMIAKKLGAKHTIARVRKPKYSNHNEMIRKSLGIDMMINPEMESGRLIAQGLGFPEAISIEQFEHGRVPMVELIIKKGSSLAGTTLINFRKQYADVLICALTRDQHTLIPTGDTVLCEGDHVYVTGSKENINRFYEKSGYEMERIKTLLVIGGGRVTYNLLRFLRKVDLDIKVIEIDRTKAENLSHDFPNAIIIHGDGTDQTLLDEERIQNFDAVVSMTGIDEENILSSLYALSVGVKKVMTKVSRTDLLKILGHMDLQTIITPKNVASNNILRTVRALKNSSGSNVEALYRFGDYEVEALQFQVKSGSDVIGIPLKELKTKPSLLVAYILRKDDLIFPTGDDEIKVGDHILVITKQKSLEDVDDIIDR